MLVAVHIHIGLSLSSLFFFFFCVHFFFLRLHRWDNVRLGLLPTVITEVNYPSNGQSSCDSDHIGRLVAHVIWSFVKNWPRLNGGKTLSATHYVNQQRSWRSQQKETEAWIP